MPWLKALALLLVVAAALGTVDVILNKSVYNPGEPVIITIVNRGLSSVRLPSSRPFRVVRLDTNETVYSMGKGPEYVLDPMGTLVLVWRQTDDRGARVPPGRYAVVVEYDGRTVSREFVIRGAARAEALLAYLPVLAALAAILAVLALVGARRRSSTLK